MTIDTSTRVICTWSVLLVNCLLYFVREMWKSNEKTFLEAGLRDRCQSYVLQKYNYWVFTLPGVNISTTNPISSTSLACLCWLFNQQQCKLWSVDSFSDIWASYSLVKGAWSKFLGIACQMSRKIRGNSRGSLNIAVIFERCPPLAGFCTVGMARRTAQWAVVGWQKRKKIL